MTSHAETGMDQRQEMVQKTQEFDFRLLRGMLTGEYLSAATLPQTRPDYPGGEGTLQKIPRRLGDDTENYRSKT